MGWLPRKNWPDLPRWAQKLSYEEKREICKQIRNSKDRRKRSLELKKLYTGQNYPIQRLANTDGVLITGYVDPETKNLVLGDPCSR